MLNSLNHFKLVAAHKHFATPADEDYLVARWALIQGFNSTFFWHAAQAVEKYLKACLLANGESTKSYGHGLGDLYGKYQSIYGALAIDALERPSVFPEESWNGDDVRVFISRLEEYGHPDSRYGLTGWNRINSDLFKFDLLCARIRRQTVGLEWIVGNDWQGDFPAEAKGGWTYRKLLEEDQGYSPIGPIKNLDWPLFDFGSTRRAFLHRWNFGFERFQSDRRRAAPPTVFNRSMLPAFENTFLHAIWEVLSGDSFWNKPDANIYFDGMDWLLPKIKLDQADLTLLNERLKKLKRTRPN